MVPGPTQVTSTLEGENNTHKKKQTKKNQENKIKVKLVLPSQIK